jgi:hypothetical protein
VLRPAPNNGADVHPATPSHAPHPSGDALLPPWPPAVIAPPPPPTRPPLTYPAAAPASSRPRTNARADGPRAMCDAVRTPSAFGAVALHPSDPAHHAPSPPPPPHPLPDFLPRLMNLTRGQVQPESLRNAVILLSRMHPNQRTWGLHGFLLALSRHWGPMPMGEAPRRVVGGSRRARLGARRARGHGAIHPPPPPSALDTCIMCRCGPCNAIVAAHLWRQQSRPGTGQRADTRHRRPRRRERGLMARAASRCIRDPGWVRWRRRRRRRSRTRRCCWACGRWVDGA